MANPFPFVAGDILTAAELNGIGEAAITFTPTFTGYTRGNGTSIAYYLRVNKLVYIYVKETLGSTSSVTSSPAMTLPITAVRAEAIAMGRSRLDDTGTEIYWGTTTPNSTTSVNLYADKASGTYVSFQTISSTIPFTWVTTDAFTLAFVYEAA